jgi:hypothetical protein
MVDRDNDEVVERDYTRASQVLIAIGLRILEEEENVEANSGLRPRVN